MTTLPFLSGATGDPILTKRRLAPQATLGVPATTGFSDFRSNGGPIVISPKTIARRIISPEPKPPMKGKFDVGGGPLDIGDAEPGNPAMLLLYANILRKYDKLGGNISIVSITRSSTTATVTVASTAALTTGQEVWITGATQTEYNGRFTITVVDGTTFTYTVTGTPATPATGTPVYSTLGYVLWRFGIGRGTAADPYLTLLSDNDVTPRARFRDILVNQMTLAAAPSQNLGLIAQLAVGEFDLFGAVTQVTGSGSTLPIFSKFWSGQYDPDATDNDLYLKDLTSTTCRGKVGLSSSYDSVHAADAYALGEHSRFYRELVDTIDRRVGEFAEQVRHYRPVGATRADNDVFKVLNRMAAWAQVLGVERPISSVSTAVLLNGVEIKSEGGFSAQISAPGNQRVPNTSGRQDSRTRKTGEVNCVINIKREIDGLDLQAALMRGDQVSVVLEAYTDTEIGISGEPYRMRVVVAAGTPEGDTFDTPAGGQDRTETMNINAGIPASALTYQGVQYSDAVTVEIATDIQSLSGT